MKRIVNEPTAAALAYGFSRGLDQKVLVYDLGGGTFDVSVLQLSGNVFEVLATGGDTFLGGVDFDNRIIDFVLEDFWRQHKIDLAQSPIAMQRVKKGAEAAKIDLSLIPNVAIDLPYIEEKKGRPLDIRMQLSRQQLDDLTQRPRRSHLRDLRPGARRAEHPAGRDRRDHPRRRAEPDAARAAEDPGALRPAAAQGRPPRRVRRARRGAPRRLARQHRLGDARRRALDADRHRDARRTTSGKILEKNQTIPSTKSFRLPPPREPGQPIEIDIYQGESDLIVDNEFLGSIRLPAAATGRRIDFKLDEECLLKVSFDDPVKGMTEIELATRDTPEALRQARSPRRRGSARSSAAAPRRRASGAAGSSAG